MERATSARTAGWCEHWDRSGVWLTRSGGVGVVYNGQARRILAMLHDRNARMQQHTMTAQISSDKGTLPPLPTHVVPSLGSLPV